MKWYQRCYGGGLQAAEKSTSPPHLEFNSSYTAGLQSSALNLCWGYLYRGAVGAVIVADGLGFVPAAGGYSLFSNILVPVTLKVCHP